MFRLPRRVFQRSRAEARGPVWPDGQPLGRPQVKADDGYIRDSMLLPKRDVVAGYESMPSFAGLLDDGEVQSLTAYIRSLASPTEKQADGEAK